MSFGWSAGDIALCIKLCIDICRFYQNAEQDVQDVLTSFQYAREQLDSLETLLRETRWPRYPFASQFKKDLENHFLFFQALPSLSGQAAPQGPTLLSKSRDKAK